MTVRREREKRAAAEKLLSEEQLVRKDKGDAERLRVEAQSRKRAQRQQYKEHLEGQLRDRRI